MNVLAPSSRAAAMLIAGVIALSLGTEGAVAQAAEADRLRLQLTEEDRQAIAALPHKFVEGALADDWDAVAKLYHEDAIQMPPDEAPVMSRDGIRQALAETLGSEGGVTLTTLSLDVLETEGLGDLVYVRATYRFEISMMVDEEEVTLQQQGPYVNILRRDEAGTWLIYRQIYNRDHPPLHPD